MRLILANKTTSIAFKNIWITGLYEAKKKAGPTGKVICWAHREVSLNTVRELGLADVLISGDATNATEVYEKIMEATDGQLCDLVISVVSRPNCEMSAILATKDEGKAKD
jgi:L-erythro-3,5-diaminohexanoate dehydrogenase